jgi:hypothetical protein
MVMSDIYRPHTYEETAALLSAEAALALEPGTEYGIRWWNRVSQKRRQVSEPDGNGERRYRKRTTTVKRGRVEWIAVPAWLSRDLVSSHGRSKRYRVDAIAKTEVSGRAARE